MGLTNCIVDGGVFAAAQEHGVEINHDEAAVLGNRLQYVVLHVPARVAQLVRGRVGEDYWRLRHLQRVPHRSHGSVRQIHYHAKAIHFLDYCLFMGTSGIRDGERLRRGD